MKFISTNTAYITIDNTKQKYKYCKNERPSVTKGYDNTVETKTVNWCVRYSSGRSEGGREVTAILRVTLRHVTLRYRYWCVHFIGRLVLECWGGWPKVWGILGFRLGLVVESGGEIRTVGIRSRRRCNRFGCSGRLGQRRTRLLGTQPLVLQHRSSGNRPILVWYRFRFGSWKP